MKLIGHGFEVYDSMMSENPSMRKSEGRSALAGDSVTSVLKLFYVVELRQLVPWLKDTKR